MDVPEILTVRDKNGVPRIILSADHRLPTITLRGENHSAIVFEVHEDSLRVRMRGADGSDAVEIGASGSHVGCVVFDRGKHRFAIEIDTVKDLASLVAFDRRGNESKRVTL